MGDRKLVTNTLKQYDAEMFDDDGVVELYVAAIDVARADMKESIELYTELCAETTKIENLILNSEEEVLLKEVLSKLNKSTDRTRLELFAKRPNKKKDDIRKNEEDAEYFKPILSEYDDMALRKIETAVKRWCKLEKLKAKRNEAMSTAVECKEFISMIEGLCR